MEGQNNQQTKPAEIIPTTSKVRMSKMNIAKNSGSEVSLTPSQAAEQGKNSRKNPLDALSRSVKSGAFERRSGLQDVDDDYLQKNLFARPKNQKSSGLEPITTAVSRMQVSDGNSQQRGEPQSFTPVQVESQPAAGAYQQHHPQQHYQHAVVNQQQQQQQQQPPQQHQQGAQQYHHYQQNVPAAGQQAQQQPAAIASAQSLVQGQGQQQQQPQRMAAGGYIDTSSAGSGEPDMCTTCPNCQTTLYLVSNRGANVVENNANNNSNNNANNNMMNNNAGANNMADDINNR